TTRGFALTDTDRLHGFVIETLLCRFALRRDELAPFGAAGTVLFDAAGVIAAMDTDGIMRADADCFSVTEQGRPFVRAIAARFDTYLAGGTARHSLAV
ncbi:MAG: coproporphyrinogen III oxidase, partial [Ferrovibrio sp.]